jgi:hypothetical protein
MKTIRTYQNSAEAAFAQSLLEAAGIPATLLDETMARTVSVIPWPMRLQVPERDAERALEILNGKAGLNPEPPDEPVPLEPEADFPESSNNPYEILLLATPFILGGILLLLKTGGAAVVIHGGANSVRARGSYNGVIDASMVHDIGIIGLVIGGALVLLYLYVRRELSRDSS